MKPTLSFLFNIFAVVMFTFTAWSTENPESCQNDVASGFQNILSVSSGTSHGNGTVTVHGQLKQWHKVTLTMEGPFARETDDELNPFTDYRMMVTFRHASGYPEYEVPGYFAADGKAGETGAEEGNKWRAHLSPDKTGQWSYQVTFLRGKHVALADMPWAKPLKPYDGRRGTFMVEPSDKSGRDFRGKGRLEYVGKHHLQFQCSKEYFLKAGADAPETFMAYKQFDGTYTVKEPLKTYEPHLRDWSNGDPTWQDGKGKGIIGAINYLSEKGANAFSFLTYNAGGDGDNVWPFVKRDTKLHYDCSKLDQWQIVFDHAQKKGMYLHFKTQETENDNDQKNKVVKTAMDGGDLGPERRLYYRELVARYAYLLALNWNLGEENSQTIKQRRAMAWYFDKMDPYKHNIVIHSYPNAQEEVYGPLLGNNSCLTGTSLQNYWSAVHHRTLQWIKASDLTGKPWVVANDEQNTATYGVPPDPGYKDFDPSKLDYDLHDIRKQTLWGNLMAGGAGVEYYFGYALPQNDLTLEDFRSRDRTWEYSAVALNFFKQHEIPFWEMKNRNGLIGNASDSKEKYCLAKEGEVYLVYLGYTPTSSLDLSGAEGTFSVLWFSPRKGGDLLTGSVTSVTGGNNVSLGEPPMDPGKDWLVVVKKE